MALIKLKAFVVPVINSNVTESIKLRYNECPHRRAHLFFFLITKWQPPLKAVRPRPRIASLENLFSFTGMSDHVGMTYKL
jgi:hypothetical protein